MKHLLDERFILIEEDTQQAQEQTWEERFAAAKTGPELDNFWKDFFTKTFGDHASVIQKEFGLTFSVANKYLGWTAEENPLIELFNTKFDDIFNKENNYTQNYFSRIIEADKQNLIDLQDLVTPNEALGTYDILNNKNFRLLDTSTFKEWLRLRNEVMRSDVPNKGILFANAYLQSGSAKADTAMSESQANSGVLLNIQRAVKKLSKFLGKDLGGKQDFSDKDLEKLLKANNPATLQQYFYYSYDIFVALYNENVLKALGADIAVALDKFQATQVKPVAPEVKKKCRADIGFATRKVDLKKACTILYNLAKAAGYKELPELTKDKAES